MRSERERIAALLLTVVCTAASGCYRDTKLVTVTFTDRSESSDYWVCPARTAPEAGTCRGRLDDDIDDGAYSPNMDVLAPPAECTFGVAKLEIVVRRHEVLRVGYACADAPVPTTLPTETPLDSGLPIATGGGLPPEREAPAGGATGAPPP